MKTKQEVLTYLAKQIEDKKSVIEYTRKQGDSGPMHQIIIDDWKEEIRVLLTAMDFVLESK